MSLFAGVGGFDLAAEWMGWETTVMVEWDKLRQSWLKELYPAAAIWGDIDNFDNTQYRGAIDIIFGGEPCQGNSVAGNRQGTTDPRFKWPQYLQQVDEVGPLWSVNENVPGSISNGILDRKILDLAAIGYACWPPLVIPARAVGANHERERVYLVAYSVRSGRWQLNPPPLPAQQAKRTLRDGTECASAFRPVAGYADTSEILREADGLSSGIPANHRNKAIESLGNAIVPQVAYQIFKAIQHVNNSIF